MLVQKFRTICDNCGEEVTSMIGNMPGNNDVIVDFLEDMEFECSCGATTCISIEKEIS